MAIKTQKICNLWQYNVNKFAIYGNESKQCEWLFLTSIFVVTM